jgi:hypothetical protein
MRFGKPGISDEEVVDAGGVLFNGGLDVVDGMLPSAALVEVAAGELLEEGLNELVVLLIPLPLLFNRRNAARAAASLGVVEVPGSLIEFELPGSPGDSGDEVGVG